MESHVAEDIITCVGEDVLMHMVPHLWDEMVRDTAVSRCSEELAQLCKVYGGLSLQVLMLQQIVQGLVRPGNPEDPLREEDDEKLILLGQVKSGVVRKAQLYLASAGTYDWGMKK